MEESSQSERRTAIARATEAGRKFAVLLVVFFLTNLVMACPAFIGATIYLFYPTLWIIAPLAALWAAVFVLLRSACRNLGKEVK